MIEDFLNEKRVYLSEEYVKGLYKTLKVIFGYAYKRKYMKKDIFCEVTPPPDPRHIGEIKTYTQEAVSYTHLVLEPFLYCWKPGRQW